MAKKRRGCGEAYGSKICGAKGNRKKTVQVREEINRAIKKRNSGDGEEETEKTGRVSERLKMN